MGHVSFQIMLLTLPDGRSRAREAPVLKIIYNRSEALSSRRFLIPANTLPDGDPFRDVHF
jgi:hypothetical protein